MISKGRDVEEHIKADIGYRESSNSCQNCKYSICESPSFLYCRYNPSFKLKVKHLGICDKQIRI